MNVTAQMMLDYSAFGIPGFLFFIALEYMCAKWNKKNYFTFETSAINISIGIAERAISLLILGLFFNVFDFIQKNYGLLSIPSNAYTGVLLFIGVDFVWYWYHRLGHEVNLLWSAHIVHHQSEVFNFTVSARITIFQAVFRNAFWCVLPLLGFSAESLTICLLVHGVYPFFLHTRTIGKLGLLEYFFVTPSHHRVHHASNEIYLDKNYGDVLIIWDKLFGTFQQETEEPIYGLTKPLESNSFLWQHFHQLLELLYTVQATPGWQNKVALVFGRPSAIPYNTRDKLESVYLTERLVRVDKKGIRLRFYIALQMAIALFVLFLLTLLHRMLDVSVMTAGTVFIILTLINCGAILDQKCWVFYPECARGMLVLITAVFYFPHPVVWIGFILSAGILSYYFKTAERRFIALLYGYHIGQVLKS